MTSLVTFPGGLRLALVPMPHMASVSLGFWVGVGGRAEPAPLSGVSHFIEHMLFKGTRRRSARELSQAVEGIGGYLNAFTSEENTCFYAKARHDRFEELLDVLADMVLESRLDPEDLDRERAVILEEIAMYRDQAQQYVQELLNALSWPGQPLGRSLTGTPRTVGGLRREDLVAHHRRHYVASQTVVSVAGRFRPARVIRAVAELARRFPAGPRVSFEPVRIVQRRPGVFLCTRKTEQTQIALGVRTCSRHDDRRFALRLLNVVLGEATSSRLFQTVREDLGLAYSIYSALSFFEDTGDLVISAGLDDRNLVRTLLLMVGELRRLAERPPGRAEFAKARDYVLGQLDLGLEGTESQMQAAGEHVLSFATPFRAQAVRRRLARVAPADLSAAARDFFRPERMNLALVSPIRSTRGLGRVLGGP